MRKSCLLIRNAVCVCVGGDVESEDHVLFYCNIYMDVKIEKMDANVQK